MERKTKLLKSPIIPAYQYGDPAKSLDGIRYERRKQKQEEAKKRLKQRAEDLFK